MNEKNTPPDARAGHVRAADTLAAAAMHRPLGISQDDAQALITVARTHPELLKSFITLAKATSGGHESEPLQLASAIDTVLKTATDDEGRQAVLSHLA